MDYMEDVLKTEFNERFISRLKIDFDQFDEEFVQMMRNRMVVSYSKYGPVKDNIEGNYTNTLKNIRRRIEKYRDTGNTEWLIDVANMCMIEWWYPQVGTPLDIHEMIRLDELSQIFLPRVDIMQICLERYEDSRNLDFIICCAQLCILEWKCPEHPEGHFRATDSHESPGLVGTTINQEQRKRDWWNR